MRKILIINLRRLGDVYSTAHLINSLTAEGNCQISLLTFQESAKAAKNLKNITHTYTIDRKEIITLKTNKLFSDGFAFEQLFTQVSALKSEQWDQIINYSNDVVGAYLTSYLKESCKQVIGVHFNSERNVVTHSDWELLFNDVLPVVNFAPIHFVDCYHKMAGVQLTKEGEKLNTNQRYNEAAFNNINNVRKSYNLREGQSKIIGIQLKTSDPAKDLPENILHELMVLIRENSELIPFILIAPNDEERLFAENFIKSHDNQVMVIEADLLAVASVMMNIDLLVTPDTAIKHIADLTDTPVLEISLGHAPFLKQGTYSRDSLILTDLISNRSFNQKAPIKETAISAPDIMACILFSLAKSKTIKPLLTTGVTLYQTSFDKMGIRYSPIAGTVDTKIEIHRLMSRQIISSIFEQDLDDSIYRDVCNLDLKTASEWTKNEKVTITNVMKDLLGTLRALLQCTETRKSSKDFVIHLGKLISHAENQSLAQIPVSMFKSKVEGINVKSFEENSKELEVLMYELKTDVQKILQNLQELEVHIHSVKTEDMITKNLEATKA